MDFEESNTPEIACVVLSLNNQSSLVKAVRSLLNQDVPAEIIVVNSGSGNPKTRLEKAGITVPVINSEKRLLTGAARNLGILNTTAPYVAFLAADCIAHQNWLSERLRLHREGVNMVSSSLVSRKRYNPFSWASQIFFYPRRMPGTRSADQIHYGVSYVRWLFTNFGLFNGWMERGEDTEFLNRVKDVAQPKWGGNTVITAHKHPATLTRLIKDSFKRGRLIIQTRAARQKAWSARAITSQPLPRVRIWKRVRVAIRSSRHSELPLVLLSLGWVPLAVWAYKLGIRLEKQRDETITNTEKTSFNVAQIPFVGERPMKPQLIALLTFRNEMEYLPGFFRSIEGHFDGVVALDDGSTDGSYEYVKEQAGVLEVIRKLNKGESHVWNCGLNHRLLTEASWKFKPDWLIGLDADERVEMEFRKRINKFITLSRDQNILAYALRHLHPWDEPSQYRVDGIWNRKRIVRLFKARYDHQFNPSILHGQWAPLNSKLDGKYPRINAIIYHLAMLTPEKRLQRMQKYLKIDPERKWQKIGYEYLCDESGLKLKPIPKNRGYIS